MSLNFHHVPETNGDSLQASESAAHDCNAGPPEDEAGF